MITPVSSPKINLVFRLDDYSALSNTHFEGVLLAVMKKYNIPCTFGVVPFVYINEWDPAEQNPNFLPDEKVRLLSNYIEHGLVEVALHGYHHHTRAERMEGHIPSEFWGAPRELQQAKIVGGKMVLEKTFSTSVTTFIPPWNTYDAVTVQVLEEQGFRCVSTGPRFGAVGADASLKYVPALCKLADVKQLIEQARISEFSEVWVVTWFHQYDFVEVSPRRAVHGLDYKYFENLFAWLADQADVRTLTLAQASESEVFSRDVYRVASRMRNCQHWTPHFLFRMEKTSQPHPPQEMLKHRYVRWLGTMLGYYAGILTLAACLGAILAVSDSRLAWLFTAASVVAVIILSASLFKRRKIYYSGLSWLAGFMGLFLGLVAAIFFL